MSDPTEIAVPGGIGAVLGGVVAVTVQWLRSRGESARASTDKAVAEAGADAAIQVAHVQAEVQLSEILTRRLADVEARIEALHEQCERERREDREECDRQRLADRKAHRKEMTQLRAVHTSARLQDRHAIDQLMREADALRRDLAEVARRTAGEMRASHPGRPDSTTVRALDRIARRPPSDPEMQAQRPTGDDE